MEKQKCPDCSAPMILTTRNDGIRAYLCEYCGHRIDLPPQTASDHVFTFMNRIANSIEKFNAESKIIETPAPKKSLTEKIDDLERTKKAFDQRRQQLYEKAKKWGF